MRTIKDLKEFAEEELERTKDGSDDPIRDFEALRTLCEWCLEVYNYDETTQDKLIDSLARLSNAKVITTEQEDEIETEIMNYEEKEK